MSSPGSVRSARQCRLRDHGSLRPACGSRLCTVPRRRRSTGPSVDPEAYWKHPEWANAVGCRTHSIDDPCFSFLYRYNSEYIPSLALSNKSSSSGQHGTKNAGSARSVRQTNPREEENAG